MSFIHLLGHNFQAFLSKNFTACIYIYIIILYIYTGWWFGTWLLFSPIVGMMIQSDELIFFRGVGIPPIRIYIYIVYILWVFFCCEVMSIVDTSPSSLAKNHGVRVLRPRHGRLRRSETWSMEATNWALWLRNPPLALMIRWGMTFKPNISNNYRFPI